MLSKLHKGKRIAQCYIYSVSSNVPPSNHVLFTKPPPPSILLDFVSLLFHTVLPNHC